MKWLRHMVLALCLAAATLACGGKEVALEEQPASAEEQQMRQQMQQLMQQQLQANKEAFQRQLQGQGSQPRQP